MYTEPTRALAAFAAELSYEKIPPSVIDQIKFCLVDTFGCGLFGSTLPWTKIVTEFAGELGEGREAVVWGRDLRVPAPNAALVNGTSVHSFELDDLHKTSVVHPGAVTIPAGLAMAERVGGCDGKAFLTAIVAGYEVAIRVGMSVGTSHLQRGFHPTGTNGTFGAGAAAGRVLRLDKERMTHVLGIAGSQSAGLMASQYASMVKRFHAGRAAQSGVYGALLADKGFTGITDILEAGYGGYGKTMSDSADMSKVTSGLGKIFEVARVGFKPYAAGGSTHTAHEAVKHLLRKHQLTASMIEKITIHATTATFDHTNWTYKPEGVTAAQMNMPYVVTVTVLDGEVFIDQFSETRINDPEIMKFSRRVEVVPDPELDRLGPEHRHTVIAEVRTVEGKTFTKKVQTARGSHERPLSADEVVRKYSTLAGEALSQKKVGRLQDMVMSLERISDVRELGELLAA